MSKSFAMRALFSITALLAPLLAWATAPSMVAVFKAGVPTKTLASQADLSAFHRLWSHKTRQTPPHKLDWPYSLRISRGARSSLWLYHPSGWVTILSKTVVPIYKLESPEDLKHLLGMPDEYR